MPNTTSAHKALRQSVERRVRNLRRKAAFKRVVKTAERLVNAGKKSEAAKTLPKIYKALDKAAKTNAIKKNRASRLKSRITRRLHAVK